jgi:hypothetical protein
MRADGEFAPARTSEVDGDAGFRRQRRLAPPREVVIHGTDPKRGWDRSRPTLACVASASCPGPGSQVISTWAGSEVSGGNVRMPSGVDHW